ncbi:hypothetical protein [Paenibacillus mucilaginosus]|nr:hypothetical protein [Paenibacillus mucilaginosus]MCG7213636.1 hypothetical protein [Paenibacillus mucilaginosus]
MMAEQTVMVSMMSVTMMVMPMVAVPVMSMIRVIVRMPVMVVVVLVVNLIVINAPVPVLMRMPAAAAMCIGSLDMSPGFLSVTAAAAFTRVARCRSGAPFFSLRLGAFRLPAIGRKPPFAGRVTVPACCRLPLAAPRVLSLSLHRFLILTAAAAH